jgi:hypothetical protein
MPYAGTLALYQVADNAALNSAIGVLVPMVQQQFFKAKNQPKAGGSGKKNKGGNNGKNKRK